MTPGLAPLRQQSATQVDEGSRQPAMPEVRVREQVCDLANALDSGPWDLQICSSAQALNPEAIRWRVAR